MTKAYWIEGDSIFVSEYEGEIDKNDDFKYQGAFGMNTRFKDHYFLSKIDAIKDRLDDLKWDVYDAEQKHNDFMMIHHKTLHPDD